MPGAGATPLSPSSKAFSRPKPRRRPCRPTLLIRSAESEGRLLLETSQFSPHEFVLREFEYAIVHADLREKGFDYHIPALFAGNNKT